MRRLLLTLALVLGLAGVASAMPQASELTGANGTNYAILATSTNTYTNSVFTCTRGTNLSICINFKLMATNTNLVSTNVTFVFYSSNDSQNWTKEFSWSIATNSTAIISLRTNYYVQAVPFVKLYQIENPLSEAVTNCLVTAYDKPDF